MNPIGLFKASIRPATEGPEVTWIGPNPFQRGLCMGFDDGTIVLSEQATGRATKHLEISPSKEAINGVASIVTVKSRSLAVSTRSDVTFVEVMDSSNAPRVSFRGGAHGVVATSSGYFIAPRGPKGLLIVKPDREPQQKMRVTTGMEKPLYFYRMTAIHDFFHKEVLVFAHRTQGVGFCEFDGAETGRRIRTQCYDGLDVVDVCGVATGSLSAIAISPKGEVMWIKDSSSYDEPITTILTGIEGKIYRILATERTLFVLSTKALYAWNGLVEQVLFKGSNSIRVQPFAIPMEAIDMSLFDEHLCLVLAENSVVGLSVRELEREPSSYRASEPDTALSMQMSKNAKLEGFAQKSWARHDIQQAESRQEGQREMMMDLALS